MSNEKPAIADGLPSLYGKPTTIVPTTPTSSLPVRYKYVDVSTTRPDLLRFWRSLESGFELVLLERVISPWQTAHLEQPTPVLAIARFGQRIVGVDRWLPRRESYHALGHEFNHIQGFGERDAERMARQFCAASTLAPGRCRICASDFTAWLRQYAEHEL